MTSRRTLFHLHIPKTGGTTLSHALASRFDARRVLVAASGFVEPHELAAAAVDVDLVAGHFTWSAVRAFPTPPAVLTVLRDPVEWALSFYSYLRGNAAAGIFEPTMQSLAEEAAARPLGDILLDRRSRLRRTIGPIQLGYLASDRRDLRSYPSFFTEDGDLDVDGTERAIESGLRNVSACLWVGATETLDRDLQTLAARLDWRPFDPVARRMVTRDRLQAEALPSQARRELDRLVEADRALHARARALADEAYAHAFDPPRRSAP
jgi:hypothetical protein